MFQHTFSTFASKRSPTYHLSDGGHFENLGLYELLRRHCSYIIVSDAGADPNLSFADIGNALQLAREDFGIEVDIDFSALRPDDDGLSKVRVAVGRILYPAGKLGVLIYVKPVLTGDEPEDIRQYRSESRTFPHEGTADQFYDRAQWECYRKLGAHTVRRVFGFVDPSRNDTLEWIFQSAFATWSPMPGPLYKRTIEANDDYSRLITGLGQSEVAATTLLGHHLADKCPGPSADTPSAQDVVDCLNLIQTIEHVWVTCQLDDYLFHRAASGWFDFIERAASGPQFRQLWPLLRWQFSREFGGFMEKRFFWLDSDKPSGQTAITIDVECCLKKNDRAAKQFAGAHPRRPPSASAEAYADSYQLWLRVGGVERFVPDTILAATPEIGRWTVTDIEGDKRRLLDLCELLVLPGAGGLSTAASFLAKLNNKVGGRIEGPGGTLSWALIIRSTPDQQQSTIVPAASRPARLLTRSGSETEAASVIHRRAVPFIEARLGTLKFFRETEKHLLTENTRKNRGTGTLVGVVLVD